MFPVDSHKPLSPSRLSMFFACPGSYGMSRKYQSSQSSAAAEGEMLHGVIENFLAQYIEEGEEVIRQKCTDGIKDPLETLTADQRIAIDDALEYLAKVYHHVIDPLTLETQLSMAELHPALFECGGTNDVSFVTLDPDGVSTLHVLDWKFGQSEPIYALDNDQLLAYAWGQLMRAPGSGIELVTVHIVMPRLNHYDSATYDKVQMRAWLHGRAIPGAQACYAEIPEFNPGQKQCRWCPGKNQCGYRHDYARKTATEVFKRHLEIPDVSVDDLAALMPEMQALKTYIADLEKFAMQTLLSGQSFGQYKLVEGRSSRRWIDEVKAEKWLLSKCDVEQVYESKLVAPAKAEKLVRAFKKDLEFTSLWAKAPGNPTMVPESDKRPALELRDASTIFANLIQEESHE